MLNYYNRLSAKVYDMDKYIGRSFGDVEYYCERLSDCKGVILEPGVGTGRMLIPLLEQGLQVEGFDLSTEMLDICRKNCEQRGLVPNLFTGKMEDFSLKKEYEAIIVPTGTFLLLHQREKSIQALKNFYHHLADGGKLFIDIFLQTDLTIGEVSTKTWELDDGDIITLETKIVEVDYINQYTISHHRYEKWRNGELILTELERFPLRWYGIEEFKMLLERIGFGDIILSADYQFGECPTDPKQMVTFEARAHKK